MYPPIWKILHLKINSGRCILQFDPGNFHIGSRCCTEFWVFNDSLGEEGQAYQNKREEGEGFFHGFRFVLIKVKD